MSIVARVRGFQRRAHVVPVTLRRHVPERGPAELIHAAYRRHRGTFLALPAGLETVPATAVTPPARWSLGFVGWRDWFVGDVFLMSLQLLRAHGAWVRSRYGVPLWRQWLQMVALAVWLPSKPEGYYMFEWYLPQRRARARHYLHRHEMKRVVYLLLAPPPANASLKDKRAFAEHALRHGLPVVRTLATIIDGEFGLDQGADRETLRRDLFVKPVDGRGGGGTDRITYHAGSDRPYRSARSGARTTLEELVEHYAERSRSERHRAGFLVQERLLNHPEVAPLAGGALSTCRIVTIFDEIGEPEPVVAIFRMAGDADAVVDNSHAGGMAAPVDLASGRLGAAAYLVHDSSLERIREREDTGATIDGAVVPLWPEVVDLAIRAHRAFAPRLLVGWDIALTASGPVLVEANAQPCTDGLQRRHQLALGDHRFGQLVAHHLRARGVA